MCGGARSGSAIHADPVGAAWNALVVGRKRWVALPPPSVQTSDGGGVLAELEMLQLDAYDGDRQVNCRSA